MRTIINVKAEKDVKKAAQGLAKELGLSLSTVVNAYLRQFIRNRGVYFHLDYNMSSDLEKLLAGVEYDIQRGRNLSISISNKRTLKKHLASL